MSDPTKSIEPAYFEMVYRASADPWGFETSPYGAEKHAVTLAALPRARYASGFENGCSLGVLTSQLADWCDALVSRMCGSRNNDSVTAFGFEASTGIIDRSAPDGAHVCVVRVESGFQHPEGKAGMALAVDTGGIGGGVIAVVCQHGDIEGAGSERSAVQIDLMTEALEGSLDGLRLIASGNDEAYLNAFR